MFEFIMKTNNCFLKRFCYRQFIIARPIINIVEIKKEIKSTLLEKKQRNKIFSFLWIFLVTVKCIK